MKILSLFAALLLATAVVACDDSSVNPGVGSGTELKAVVNGIALTFPVNTDVAGAPSYDATTHRASFSGTIVGAPSRTLSLAFTSDISGGTYPRTVSGDAMITYVEATTSSTTGYICSMDSADCRVTLTASDGTIVDGTFQATLRNPNDTSKTASVVDGRFSIKLR